MPWRARKVVFQEFKFLDFVLNRRQSVVGVFVSFGVVRCDCFQMAQSDSLGLEPGNNVRVLSVSYACMSASQGGITCGT